VSGEFDPRGQGREWCEPEILRRIKRGTLERLRNEISPGGGDVLGRFLIDWHGIDAGRKGEARLDEVIDLLEGLPLSFAELERSILPARLPGYESRMLDERGAQGQLVWVGCRAIGEKDGRVALYRRANIAALMDAPEIAPPEGVVDPSEPAEASLGPVHRALLERLEARGASFFGELVQGIEVESSDDVFKALWELVWRGLVTNDTFAPLRALAQRPAPGRRRGRRAPPSATAGRWSLVAPLLADPPSATERLHARTLLYLNRHGIVSRETMGVESQVGGFGAIYPVLREMEEIGRIRRGYFVEGMTSAQLAVPGAVDRLRSLRDRTPASKAVLLSATDPAQPYGVQLPWPAVRKPARGKSGKPRRAIGAHVILVDGRPSLFIDKAGSRVSSFEDESNEVGAERLDRAIRALARGVGRIGRKRLSIEQIDGENARSSALAEAFVRAGFRAGYRGFEMDRPLASSEDFSNLGDQAVGDEMAATDEADPADPAD